MKKISLIPLLFCLCFSPAIVKAQLIEHALEDKGTMDYVLKNGTIDLVTSPVRVGTFAHRHQASTSQKRAEIDDNSWHAYDVKGNVYWYGMSYYLPASSFSDDINTYITQFRFSNIPEGSSSVQNCTTRECGQGGGESGSGHHIKINSSQWEFTLRHQDPDCALCKGTVTKKFFFGLIALDKWTDFVMQARWSHNTDGFVKVWKQVADGGYELVLDYQGRTWFDKYADGSHRQGQDVKAPNFTVGLYYSNKTNTRTMYTDEIRVYRQETGVDGFSMVRPDQYNIECEEQAIPATPADFSGSATATKQITLTWTEVNDKVDGYFIERKAPGEDFKLLVQLEKGASTFADNGVEDDNTYIYRISAYNCFGSSAYSDQVQIYLEKDHTQILEIDSVLASNFLGGYKPENATDGLLNTYWLTEGEGQWLQLKLQETAQISLINISFIHGNNREYNFSIETSINGTDWDLAGSFKSSGTTAGFEEYRFDEREALYIRYITSLNSVDDRTWLAEIRARGLISTSADGDAYLLRNVFHVRQSPYYKRLNLFIGDESFYNATLYTYNILGMLVKSEKISSNPYNYNTRDIVPGIYLLRLKSQNRDAVLKVGIQ